MSGGQRRIDILIALPIIMCVFFSAAAFADEMETGSSGIRIISVNSRGITVEVTASTPYMCKVDAENVTFDRFDVRDWGKTDRVGCPELPLAAFLIQVPESGELYMTIGQGDSEVLEGINTYPVPKMTLTEKGEEKELFVQDAQAYSSNNFYPENLATINRVGRLRGTAAARVEIHPYQWNAAKKELRIFGKLRVMITFENSLDADSASSSSHFLSKHSVSSKESFDIIKRKTLLNAIVSDPVSSTTQREEPKHWL